MKVIAHRGFAAEAPENTVGALVRAAELADAVEFDVRRCGSGEPVVVHDGTVDRVTGATGAVAAHSAAELDGLDVLGSGEGVPTLAAVVDALPPGTELVAELKEPAVAADALAVLADHPGPVLVASFAPEALAAVREADPGVPRGLLAGRDRDEPVAAAAELGCEAVLCHRALALRPRVPRAARRAGLACYAWTVRSRVVARELAALGVDGLIVDDRSALPWG